MQRDVSKSSKTSSQEAAIAAAATLITFASGSGEKGGVDLGGSGVDGRAGGPLATRGSTALTAVTISSSTSSRRKQLPLSQSSSQPQRQLQPQRRLVAGTNLSPPSEKDDRPTPTLAPHSSSRHSLSFIISNPTDSTDNVDNVDTSNPANIYSTPAITTSPTPSATATARTTATLPYPTDHTSKSTHTHSLGRPPPHSRSTGPSRSTLPPPSPSAPPIALDHGYHGDRNRDEEGQRAHGGREKDGDKAGDREEDTDGDDSGVGEGDLDGDRDGNGDERIRDSETEDVRMAMTTYYGKDSSWALDNFDRLRPAFVALLEMLPGNWRYFIRGKGRPNKDYCLLECSICRLDIKVPVWPDGKRQSVRDLLDHLESDDHVTIVVRATATTNRSVPLKRPREPSESGDDSGTGKPKRRHTEEGPGSSSRSVDSVDLFSGFEEDPLDVDMEEEPLSKPAYQTKEFERHLVQSRRDVTKEDLDDPELVATLAALSVWTDNQPYPSDFRALEPHISLGPVQEASKGLEIFKDAGRPVDEGEKMAGMKSPLLLAQITGAASVWQSMASTNKRGGLLLCDPVGTGKTVCALTALLLDVQQVGKIRPTLIVCPGNLTKSVWLKQAENHFKEDIAKSMKVIGSKQDWQDFLAAFKESSPPGSIRKDVAILSFELLNQMRSRSSTSRAFQPKDSELNRFKAYRVIVDEFQHLRNPRTDATKQILYFCDQPHVRHVLGLSATPTPHDIRDLHAPLRMIGVLDDKKSAYGPWSKKMPKSRDDQSQKISILLQADFYMSRGPAELDHTLVKNITPLSQRLIMSKPKITESRILKFLRDDLCKVYRAEYTRIPDALIPPHSKIFTRLDGMQYVTYSYDTFIEWYTGLPPEDQYLSGNQLACLRRAGGQASKTIKMERVIEAIKQAPSEDKILVVGADEAFMAPLQRLLTPEEIGRRSPVYLYTSSEGSRNTKDDILSDFQNDPNGGILLGPVGPISEGKNLQFCNHLYMLDTPRSPAALTQAEGRILRIGQNKSVTIRRFGTSGSADVLFEALVSGRFRNLDTTARPQISWQQLYTILELGSA